MSFRAFSYSSLPSFQLEVNKGLKEISAIENSFSSLFWKGKLCSSHPLGTFSPSCFLLLGRTSCFVELCVSLPAAPNTPFYWLRCHWGRGQWNGKFVFLNQQLHIICQGFKECGFIKRLVNSVTFKRNTESGSMRLCEGDLKWEINIIVCGFLVCHSDGKQGFALCVLNTGFSQGKSWTCKSDGDISYVVFF